jgi:hypothetical protein
MFDTVHLNLHIQRKSKMLAGKVSLHCMWYAYLDYGERSCTNTYTVTYTAQYPPPTQLPSADTKTEPDSDNLGTFSDG